MMFMKPLRIGGLVCGVGVLVLLAAERPGIAQTRPADEKRLEEIEKQIRSLQDAIKGLRAPATQAAAPTTSPTTAPSDDPISRIRDEGFNRSQVMQTLS